MLFILIKYKGKITQPSKDDSGMLNITKGFRIWRPIYV